MAPLLAGDKPPYKEYTPELHKLDQVKQEWTDKELFGAGYRLLGGFFDVANSTTGCTICCCFLKRDGTHAMVLAVTKTDSRTKLMSLSSVIDLQLHVTDNLDEQGRRSTDITDNRLLKVWGVIATKYRDKLGLSEGCYLALEMYSRIIEHEDSPLISDGTAGVRQ